MRGSPDIDANVWTLRTDFDPKRIPESIQTANRNAVMHASRSFCLTSFFGANRKALRVCLGTYAGPYTHHDHAENEPGAGLTLGLACFA